MIIIEFGKDLYSHQSKKKLETFFKKRISIKLNCSRIYK